MEGLPFLILENLSFPGLVVDDAPRCRNHSRYPAVGRSQHRSTQFNGPKKRVLKVLPRAFAFSKPAIVGDVDDHFPLALAKLAHDPGNGVLETDGRNHVDLTTSPRQREALRATPAPKIPSPRHPCHLLVDFAEPSDGIHERNKLAVNHQMLLAMDCELALRIDSQESVELLPMFFGPNAVIRSLRFHLPDPGHQVAHSGGTHALDGAGGGFVKSQILAVIIEQNPIQNNLRPNHPIDGLELDLALGFRDKLGVLFIHLGQRGQSLAFVSSVHFLTCPLDLSRHLWNVHLHHQHP